MVTKEEEWEGINWEFGVNIYTLLCITFSLEEEMATHSSILAWENHRQRSLAGYSPWGCKEPEMAEAAEHALTNDSISMM